MNKLIIFCIVYILSIIINYFSIRKMYSKNGIWEDEQPDLLDILITFIPVINITGTLGYTVANLIYLLNNNLISLITKEGTLIKFFKIKK